MPPLDRSAPYEQVAAHYRQAIRDGVLAAGVELPAVRQLAVEWGISPTTAQRAVALLRDEGWVEVRSKRPAVVRADHPA